MFTKAKPAKNQLGALLCAFPLSQKEPSAGGLSPLPSKLWVEIFHVRICGIPALVVASGIIAVKVSVALKTA